MPRGEGFEVTWEVEDGYAGKSRPQHFRIYRGDIDGIDDDKELEALFWDMVKNDFDNKISHYSESLADFLEWAKGQGGDSDD